MVARIALYLLIICLRNAIAGDDLPRMVPYYPVEIDGKWGYIDEHGAMMIEPQFDEAGPIFEAYAQVGKKVNNQMKYAALSRSKKEVRTPFVYDSVVIENSGGVIGKQDGKWFFVFGAGDSMREVPFDSIGHESVSIWPVKINGKWGYVRGGEYIISPQYEDARAMNYNYSNRIAPAKLNGKWGIIRQSGEVAIPFEFDDIGSFLVHEERIGDDFIFDWNVAAKNNGKWGIADSTGKWLIEPRFDELGSFGGVHKDVLAPAKKGDRYGYVNPRGAWLFSAKYDSALTYRSYRAPVKLDGKWGFIDEQGKLVIPAIYDEITPWYFEVRWAYVRNGETWQYIDQDGKVVWSQVTVAK